MPLSLIKNEINFAQYETILIFKRKACTIVYNINGNERYYKLD